MINFKTKTAKQFVARRLVRIIRFTRIPFNNFSIDGIRKISYTTQDARYTTNPIACSGKFLWFLMDDFLRAVHTEALSFLKSMSERGGSDKERLQSILSLFNFRVVLCRIRLIPTLISKIRWFWSELPLNFFRRKKNLQKKK